MIKEVYYEPAATLNELTGKPEVVDKKFMLTSSHKLSGDDLQFVCGFKRYSIKIESMDLIDRKDLKFTYIVYANSYKIDYIE